MEQMTNLYTIRGTFDKNYEESWDNYIKWSKLTQLTELVSLDACLNEVLVVPDYDNAEDWDYIHSVDQNLTSFFNNLEYVLRKTKLKNKYNLLTVVIEPNQDCKVIILENWEFVGYDLLDSGFCISALTNCGGFDETFLGTELNQYGLINDYLKAFDIKKRLLENNPEESHADTNVIAVWRHKTIGRTKPIE